MAAECSPSFKLESSRGARETIARAGDDQPKLTGKMSVGGTAKMAMVR